MRNLRFELSLAANLVVFNPVLSGIMDYFLRAEMILLKGHWVEEQRVWDERCRRRMLEGSMKEERLLNPVLVRKLL